MAILATEYHASYRGMKGYNGVATLTLSEPEKVIHPMYEGPVNVELARHVQKRLAHAAEPGVGAT